MANRNSHYLVCGIGINDADYEITKHSLVNGKRKITWKCPFYQKWHNMLSRCTNGERKSYTTVSVCEEWLKFSNFKCWMETQEWEGRELDKDILGGLEYSPNTCLFISPELNRLMVRSCSLNKNVYLVKKTGRWRARVGHTHIGMFDTIEQAREAAINSKIDKILRTPDSEEVKNLAKRRISQIEQ